MVSGFPDSEEIERFLTDCVARELGMQLSEIDRLCPLVAYGLDSVGAVSISGSLETWLDVRFNPTILYDHPTIAALSDALAKIVAEQKGPPAPAPEPAAAPAPTIATEEPIAIVGMSCRFPGGATSPEELWSLLEKGIDAIQEVPRERWDIDAYYDADPDAPGKMNTRWGGFLKDVDQFDAAFFDISAREARSMDPQQRLLLETSWEALEHAGESAERLMGSPGGIFVGIGPSEYAIGWIRGDAGHVDAHAVLGTVPSVAVGRLSYTFGFQGPSIPVDTACSSSLVAVHLACQSLRSGDCNLALAAGVNLLLAPEATISFSRLGAMSPDGRCKSFDASANGYVRSEGCGVLVLKRLSDAEADGNTILAVIRSSAVNQDGRSNGLTAPNGQAQQAVIRRALAQAGVVGSEIGYVEAHGTGTPLGDPIELQALSAVLGESRRLDQPVLVGSVKTNIGHTEAAAGVAGLIKTILILQKGRIPPNLHFAVPNRHLAWDKLCVKVADKAAEWPRDAARKIATVSSFGISGTNAHVVLEKATERKPVATSGEDRPLHVLVLSAKSEAAASETAERYARHLGDHPEQSFGDVCHTAAVGRSHFAERIAVVARTRGEAREKLRALASGGSTPGGVRGRAESRRRVRRVAFLFSGQGSQYLGMGKELYASQPVFRDALDRCDTILKKHVDWGLVQSLHADSAAKGGLDQTSRAQPAIFAVEYALSALWRSWGVEPEAVLGHSVGEYVAATVAGVMSLEDALGLIAERGRLTQTVERPGAMMSLQASEERVASLLKDRSQAVSIAAVNSPEHVVISGDLKDIEQLRDLFAAEGIKATRLRVSHAFHSPLMDPILSDFEQQVKRSSLHAPRLPLISNVTGAAIGEEVVSAGYWRRQLREPVRFAQGMKALLERGIDTFVEVGPHPVLLGMTALTLPTSALGVASLREGHPDWDVILRSVAELYVHGVAFDWKGFDRPYARRRVSLPTYAWQRLKHWNTGVSAQPAGRPIEPGILGRSIPTPVALQLFECTVDAPSSDAAPGGVSTTQLLSMATEAIRRVLPDGPVRIDPISISESTDLPRDASTTLQTVVTAAADREFEVAVHARRASPPADDGGAQWSLLFRAHARRARSDENPSATADVMTSTSTERRLHEPTYVHLDAGKANESIAIVELDKNAPRGPSGKISFPPLASTSAAAPVLPRQVLDVCLEMAGLAPNESAANLRFGSASLQACNRMTVYRRVAEVSHCHVVPTAPSSTRASDERTFDVLLHDDAGQCVAWLEGVRARLSAPASGDAKAQQVQVAATSAGVEGLLLRILAQLTQDEGAFGLDEDVSNVGLDSFAIMAFLRRVESTFGIELGARLRARGGSSLSIRELAACVLDARREPPKAPASAEHYSAHLERFRPAGPRLTQPAYPDVCPDLTSHLWRIEDDLELETIEGGRGAPLVLLPPLGCEAAVWGPAIRHLRANRRVIAFNLPGYGRAAQRNGPLTMDLLAAALLSVVNTLEPAKPVHLVGWSLGGFLAQMIAARAPERVRTLSLVCSTSYLPMGNTIAGHEELQRLLADDFARDQGRCSSASAAAEIRDLVFRGRENRPPRVWLQYAALLGTFDFRPHRGPIAAPTLVVAGAEDLSVPPALSREMSANIRSAKLVELPSVGHFVPLFRAEACAELIAGHTRE